MSGSLPAELAGLDKLIRLYVSIIQLSFYTVVTSPSLRSGRNLQYNRITGTIPAELAQLASLEILYLTGNRLNGTIPEAMGTFPSMREMFISGNWIHGQIPAVLANLKNLRSLHLEDAHFTGTIPAELAQLDQLQTLDIRGNKLLGTIPKNLLDQPSLRSVYILQAPGYDFYCTDLEIFKAKSLRTDVKETSPCAVYDPAAKESVIVTVITVSGGDDPTWFAASTSAQHRYRLGMSILFGVDEMKVVLDTVSVDDDGAIVITSLVTVPAQVDAPTTASAFKVANYFDVSNALSQNVLDIDAFPKQA
eukprot:TRINITY_DN2693_c1_g1::TRINITY_DN2693_c1_g1_i5::g.26064::m.26064 TRINITY_DN2693_c1_g1::TRINITY_DN2693_c1_g1_i5::g.26064  ORF type:complete len:306 (-),score=105.71,sp/Q9LP24/Y1571_ARATH/35.39/1e-21,sp/Q9LP24/Y1571_ARATH/32.64/1e-20,sp/Q9LP24/Y1571_ARATH/37.91/2e-20,sp/Q9LP24/Y1571_ARATH/35.93/3e-17,sp/Q9LP24/Y1571_ARATH/29.03/6e-14,sp/Q9LP24/Y1571_ARATH/36.19/2e-13,sp/Q9LP24/Y1571_ARATH/31.33/9e-13,sp/Q9LP24/Y1571_ARATH/31.33/4e-12,sp/Q9LP24/Y1571_ARATH/30.72/1e-11,sp/Q9LP24/Y1571_ARATH/34.48/3e-